MRSRASSHRLVLSFAGLRILRDLQAAAADHDAEGMLVVRRVMRTESAVGLAQVQFELSVPSVMDSGPRKAAGCLSPLACAPHTAPSRAVHLP